MDNLVRPFLAADKKRLIPPAIPGLGLVNGGNGTLQKNWKGSQELLSNRKDDADLNPQLAEIDSKLGEVREFISAYFERLDDKDKKEKMGKEWKAVGLIFDRLFFWVYLVTILTSLTLVLSFIFTGS